MIMVLILMVLLSLFAWAVSPSRPRHPERAPWQVRTGQQSAAGATQKSEPGPESSVAVDDGCVLWTPSDDRQLARLLRRAAPRPAGSDPVVTDTTRDAQ
jgi:hypothetical protein